MKARAPDQLLTIRDLPDHTLQTVINAFDDETAGTVIVLSNHTAESISISRPEAFREFARRCTEQDRET